MIHNSRSRSRKILQWSRKLASSKSKGATCNTCNFSPSQHHHLWRGVRLLSSTSHPTSSPVADDNMSSTSWKDWFQPSQYLNPWDLKETSSWLPPLGLIETPPHRNESTPKSYTTTTTTNLMKLEHSSRHVIQLLQELQLHHHPLTHDRVTVERCRVVLQQLLSRPPHCTGRAERAQAILNGMEAFRSILDHGPQRRLSCHPPIPTRDTYQLVLRIYASSTSHDVVEYTPRWTQEIVERMQMLYTTEGILELKPHAFHWNCVLLAWSHNPQWDKSLSAAKVFLNHRHVLDSSSYAIMLRMCGHNPISDKAAELGAHVAVKLWQDTIEQEQEQQQQQVLDVAVPPPDLDTEIDNAVTDNSKVIVPELSSHAYVFFLQAIRSLPQGPLRNQYYRACWERAVQHGKVNPILINEVLVHNTDSTLFEQYFRPYYDENRNNWLHMPPGQVSRLLHEQIPEAWRHKAEPVAKHVGKETVNPL